MSQRERLRDFQKLALISFIAVASGSALDDARAIIWLQIEWVLQLERRLAYSTFRLLIKHLFQIDRDLCHMVRDSCQVDSDSCQVDSVPCRIDRYRCQLARDFCQIDRNSCQVARDSCQVDTVRCQLDRYPCQITRDCRRIRYSFNSNWCTFRSYAQGALSNW